MLALVLLLALLLGVAFSIAGHLHRIAQAIEKQNKHYKVGEDA